MADEKDEKTVEVELLADGILVDGNEFVRGDVVKLPESHAKVLEKAGSVGPKGTIEKADEEAADAEEIAAREQRLLTGLEKVEPPAKRGPGRPRKTESSGE